jgi:hypothetical protein
VWMPMFVTLLSVNNEALELISVGSCNWFIVVSSIMCETLLSVFVLLGATM